MSNRLQRKLRDIKEGLVDADDSYLSAEHALRNWGVWNRAVKNPEPRESAKSSSLFQNIPSAYYDDDEDEEKDPDPIVSEAELTEKLITKVCSRRDMDVLVATYVYRMQKDRTLMYLRERKHKHIYRDSYRRILDSALSKLTVMINEHWDIKSDTVIPNRGQPLEASFNYQVKVMERSV